MSLKFSFSICLFVLTTVVCTAHSIPKQGVVMDYDEVSGIANVFDSSKSPVEEEETSTLTRSNPVAGGLTFHRTPCSAEGPVADQICLDFCTPRGYTRGICVNKDCYCV